MLMGLKFHLSIQLNSQRVPVSALSEECYSVKKLGWHLVNRS